MLDNTKLIKKLVGSFIGVAGVSTLIGFPGLAQANFNSGLSNSSSQSILAQSPSVNTNPTPSTTSAPGASDSTPSGGNIYTPDTTTPSGGATSAPGTTTNGGTSTPRSNNSSSSLSALDRKFMNKAAQSDNTEIKTSQLALKKSQNKQVRDFAQRMIKEHTDSTNQLKQIAKPKGVTLPKDVGPNQALVTKLTNLNGKAFDKAYMQAQVQAHSKTLNDYQAYIQQGKNPELQAFATKIQPVVQEHLQMAQSMVAGL